MIQRLFRYVVGVGGPQLQQKTGSVFDRSLLMAGAYVREFRILNRLQLLIPFPSCVCVPVLFLCSGCASTPHMYCICRLGPFVLMDPSTAPHIRDRDSVWLYLSFPSSPSTSLVRERVIHVANISLGYIFVRHLASTYWGHSSHFTT